MATEREMKELALSKMGPLIESLAKRADEGDHQAARLLAELAGMSRAAAGRPATKKQRDYVEMTPEEMKVQTELVNEILEENGQGDVSREGKHSAS